jgi:hypothetical protein
MSFISLRTLAFVALLWFLVMPGLAMLGGRAKESPGFARNLKISIAALVGLLLFFRVRFLFILILGILGLGIYLGRRIRLR